MNIDKIVDVIDELALGAEDAACDEDFTVAAQNAHAERAKALREAISMLKDYKDAQVNEPLTGGWISVNDRLPESGIPVLIYNPHWNYGVVANYAGCGVWMDSYKQRMTYTPTHWHPLPEPPKEVR